VTSSRRRQLPLKTPIEGPIGRPPIFSRASVPAFSYSEPLFFFRYQRNLSSLAVPAGIPRFSHPHFPGQHCSGRIICRPHPPPASRDRADPVCSLFSRPHPPPTTCPFLMRSIPISFSSDPGPSPSIEEIFLTNLSGPASCLFGLARPSRPPCKSFTR